MLAEIYWITENLAIMPHPRGYDWLEDEIVSYKNFGVDVVVSLLERSEAYDLDIVKEEFLCSEKGILYLNLPIADKKVPEYFEKTSEFIKKLQSFIDENKKLAIHCRQGIGRPSMIAACLLVLQGFSVEDAFKKIADARGCEVPDTEEQRNWVKLFAQNLKNQEKIN